MAGTTSGFEKLNYNNYTYWSSCIESYLQGQDLWEVVCGSKTVPPTVKTKTVTVPKENPTAEEPKTTTIVEEDDEDLRKWKVKAGKAMYVLKTTIDKELVEYIRKAETPKVA